MKILVVSLLRLGDIVLTTPALRGLKERYPGCELHILINKQFQGIAPLLPYVDHFHYFDREIMQDALVQADRSLFEAYDRFSEFIKPLKNQNYNLIVNMTQNKLSGWLVSALPAKEKLGLHFSETKGAQFGSPWFRHLNQWGLEKQEGPQFHFSDIFLNGAVGSGIDLNYEVHETVAGKDEARKILGGSEKLITVQLLTNDEKKNWKEEHFYQAVSMFKKMNSQYDIFLLCSPSEKKRVQTFCDRFQNPGIRVAECTLEGLYSLLKLSSLLITGDTAVKHLASAAKAPILELSIGSSHYFQTGSYLTDSLIIQSKEPCAPCHHSQSCTQTSHFCSERIPGDLVGLIATKFLQKDWQGVRIISEEFKDFALVMRVAKLSAGHWTAIPLTEHPSDDYLDHLFDQLSWYLLLNSEHHKPINEIGSLGRKLGSFFEKYFSSYNKEDISLRLHDFDSQLERLEAKIDVFLVDFQEVIKNFSVDKNLEIFCQNLNDYSFALGQKNVFTSYARALNGTQWLNSNDEKFVLLRRVKDSLFDVKHRCQLQAKLIRSVKSYMENHL